MRFDIVDVFAEAPLQGNQLAVVHDAAALSSEQMQSIAREMNFSETTFVLDRSDELARVRIFTPDQELPFAGHPTLGTAWVLGRERDSFILDLPAGKVQVTFDPAADNSGICWMAPPMPKVLGRLDERSAAALLSLEPDALDADYSPVQIELGPKFTFVGVRDESVLKQINVNVAVRDQLLADGQAARSIFIFCKAQATDYAARMFFEGGGLREDPATGSANSAFAIYLRDHCDVAPGKFVVAQGDYMQRPSRIHLDIAGDSYRVGGRVFGVATGDLSL